MNEVKISTIEELLNYMYDNPDKMSEILEQFKMAILATIGLAAMCNLKKIEGGTITIKDDGKIEGYATITYKNGKSLKCIVSKNQTEDTP
jgi:hypothetical protein